MARRDDGGSVFPTYRTTGVISRPEGGVSLRDHFAAAALTGICSSNDESPIGEWNWGNIAGWAYKAADAMILERDLTLDITDPDEEDEDLPTHDIGDPGAKLDILPVVGLHIPPLDDPEAADIGDLPPAGESATRGGIIR